MRAVLSITEAALVSARCWWPYYMGGGNTPGRKPPPQAPRSRSSMSPMQKKVNKAVSIGVIIKILKTREKEKDLGSSHTGNMVQRTRGGDNNLQLLPEVKDASIAWDSRCDFQRWKWMFLKFSYSLCELIPLLCL